MKLIKNVFFIFILLLFSLAGHTQHLPASLVEIIQEENSFTGLYTERYNVDGR